MNPIVNVFQQLARPNGHVIMIGNDQEVEAEFRQMGLAFETVRTDAKCEKCGKDDMHCIWGNWPAKRVGEWFFSQDMHNVPDKRLDYAFKKLIEFVRFGGMVAAPATTSKPVQWWVDKATQHFRHVRNMSVDDKTAVVFMRNDRPAI